MAGSGAGLGFTTGQVVQEFYYDEDVAFPVRDAVEAATGEALVGPDYDDVTDGALVWWRADDAAEEDLVDVLVDVQANLDNGGLIWVLSPNARSHGHVPPTEIAEAARLAGMNATSAAAVSADWSGTRLTSRSRHA
ncbi:MAG: DUF3052 domain-containing protein [Buchananella hordeovulneris]|nr:DUF3052 domain-containing protein [Buchananella hordeovulneris]